METENRVIKILSELSGQEGITPQDTLKDNLGLDSLNMVSMLLLFEEEFEIEFKECDMNPYDLLNVADAVSLVERYNEMKNEN